MELQVRLIVADSLESASLADSERKMSTDTYHFVNDQFKVEDAREVIKRLASKSFGDSIQTVVVRFLRATVEAQNALLKSFEEPLPGNRLILIVSHESVLLPTLRSRFTSIETTTTETDNSLAKEFVSMSYADRLETIAAKVKEKNTAWINNLVMSLGDCVAEIKLDPTKRLDLERSLNLAALNIRRPGASVKMLLENIALSLPVK